MCIITAMTRAAPLIEHLSLEGAREMNYSGGEGLRHASVEKKDGKPELDSFVTKMQIKSVSETGEIEGYGSVFGQVDSVNDIVAKGAFANSLRDHRSQGTAPKMLWQHDANQPCGIWQEFEETDYGLRMKGQLLLQTRVGKEAHEFTKAKAVDGMSIGFKTLKYEYQTATDIRVLTEVDLWEVSLVTFPALRSAKITAVKSELTERRVEQILRDVGFSVAQAKAMTATWKKTVPAHRDDEGADVDLSDIMTSIKRLSATIEGRIK